MTSGIYAIRSEDNRVLYVGQSVEIENRFIRHNKQLLEEKHFNHFLQRVYKKNPIFVYEIVEVVERKLLTEREIFWINELNPRCNLIIPKTSDSWTHSDITKQKMSAAGRGRKKSPEHIKKIIDNTMVTKAKRIIENGPYPVWNKGFTADTDSRISNAPKSEEFKAQASKRMVGNKVSEETRAKISETLKVTTSDTNYRKMLSERIRNSMTPEVRKKISDARMGQTPWNKDTPRTDEVKQKLSDNWAKRPTVECPHCGKFFRLLNSHITKSHKDIL